MYNKKIFDTGVSSEKYIIECVTEYIGNFSSPH